MIAAWEAQQQWRFFGTDHLAWLTHENLTEKEVKPLEQTTRAIAFKARADLPDDMRWSIAFYAGEIEVGKLLDIAVPDDRAYFFDVELHEDKDPSVHVGEFLMNVVEWNSDIISENYRWTDARRKAFRRKLREVFSHER